jgi:hypothetical protein
MTCVISLTGDFQAVFADGARTAAAPAVPQIFTVLAGFMHPDLTTYGGSIEDLLQLVLGSDPARQVRKPHVRPISSHITLITCCRCLRA